MKTKMKHLDSTHTKPRLNLEDVVVKSNSLPKMKPDKPEMNELIRGVLEILILKDEYTADQAVREIRDILDAELMKQEEQHKAEMEAVQKIDWDIDVRYEKDLITAFNKFIKKWCGSHYAHLIDDDEQDGQYIRDKIEQLKQQYRAELEGLKMEIWKHEPETAASPTPEFPDGNGSDRFFAVMEGYNRAVLKFNEAITNLLEQKGK